MDEIEKRLQQLEKATAAQSSNGTYNCNPYMWGLANGLILALHTMRGDTVEVPYKHKPDEWLDDRYEMLKAQGRLPKGGEVKHQADEDEAPYAAHYKGYPFEPVDIAEAYQLDFNEGNVVKYLLRWRKKDGIKDLHKARYYIERLISLEERRLHEAGEQ